MNAEELRLLASLGPHRRVDDVGNVWNITGLGIGGKVILERVDANRQLITIREDVEVVRSWALAQAFDPEDYDVPVWWVNLDADGIVSNPMSEAQADRNATRRRIARVPLRPVWSQAVLMVQPEQDDEEPIIIPPRPIV